MIDGSFSFSYYFGCLSSTRIEQNEPKDYVLEIIVKILRFERDHHK